MENYKNYKFYSKKVEKIINRILDTHNEQNQLALFGMFLCDVEMAKIQEPDKSLDYYELVAVQSLIDFISQKIKEADEDSITNYYKKNGFKRLFCRKTERNFLLLGPFGGKVINIEKAIKVSKIFAKDCNLKRDLIYIDTMNHLHKFPLFKYLGSYEDYQKPNPKAEIIDDYLEYFGFVV